MEEAVRVGRLAQYIMQYHAKTLARGKRLQCEPDAMAYHVKYEKLWEEYTSSNGKQQK